MRRHGWGAASDDKFEASHEAGKGSKGGVKEHLQVLDMVLRHQRFMIGCFVKKA